MAEPRRRRAATVEKVSRLLDATEELMLSEGYAAVSSRSVAARIDITAPLLHYYFPTIDDLFVAVLRRRAEQMLARTRAALSSPQPLRAWWELVSDPRGTGLIVEFVAAANHRPALRTEVGLVARELRRLQMEALASILGEYGLDPEDFPPALVAAAVQGLAFAVVADRAAGHDTAHEQAAAAMARLVARLEDRRERRPAE
ncbi:TetR family transcriptional regulator [Parafrankia colletiae]|uniref:TetR family transcriptional regulator n=1 Tax=Parafrankia colletiae TaxID=573497 RepID=A0A1S1QNV7_9ACTN|nr:TetR/AcrR family transcriptional regulator [Parafrankia colletiae]MCK9901789.1 TetR/AcrR family transcriptional regulator [Frankia sp. Cpl3]OHV34024.1 TetR family transcriptional regulator [Parafrankia colletiae]